MRLSTRFRLIAEEVNNEAQGASRMVFANAQKFTLGCLALCAVALATCFQIAHPIIWTEFTLLCIVTTARAAPMFADYRWGIFRLRRPKLPISAGGYYAIGGLLHMFLIGTWVATIFTLFPLPIAELFSFTAAMCFMIGVVGRNFASRRLVTAQIMAVALPICVGLLLVGTVWYTIFAGFFVIFCLTLLRISDDMRDTLESALRAADDNYRLAYLDDLTGLPNRGQMKRLIDAAIASQRPFALHFMDLDRFKRLNDSYGHPFGDRVLVHTSKRIRVIAEEGAVLSRFSGDEFVLIQYGASEPAHSAALVQRLLGELQRSTVIDGVSLIVGGSIGTAFFPKDAQNTSEILRQADMALYAAKGAGRGCQRYFNTEMQDVEMRRMRVESQLRAAMDNGELSLAFQPLIDARERRVTTCEALIRWDHPVEGRIPPDQFLPVVEECGLMDAITEFTLTRACTMASAWPAHVNVAVNISPNQLKREDIVERVCEIARDAGLSLSRLELEITENLFLERDATLLRKLDELRRHGVKLSLDDFGTGYSNLSQLARLPLDKIKIDKAFIENAVTDRADRELLRGIVTLIGALKIAIVVEGVETFAQLDILMEDGMVDEIQGFLFSKPLPGSVILDLLKHSEGRGIVEARESDLSTTALIPRAQLSL